MQSTIVYFLEILDSFVHDNKPSTPPKDIDWEEVYKYANSHQICGIVYYQCKGFLNEEYRNSFAQHLYAEIHSATKRSTVLIALNQALQGYDYVLFKGAAVEQLYSNKGLRTMGDLDIMIHPKNREQVHNALETNGFQFSKKDIDDWKYIKNGIEIEVHDTLIHSGNGSEKYVSFFERAWDYADGHTLDWNFHLIYLVCHIRYHLLAHGVGFRQFMDIALIVKKYTIDYEWVMNELNKLDLVDFGKIVLGLVEKWFHVNTGYGDRISDDLYNRATIDILYNGVFGFTNMDNINFDPVVALAKNKNISHNKAKILNIVYIFFPPTQILIKEKRFLYVRDRKFLLPIAWIHRGIVRVANKKCWQDTWMRIRKTQDSDKSRFERLKYWGL